MAALDEEGAGNVIPADGDPVHNGCVWNLIYILLGTFMGLFFTFILFRVCISCKSRYQRKKWRLHELSVKPVMVGFFHPYCNSGGGGERVLWQSISALQRRYSFIRCVVYTGYEADSKPAQIIAKVKERFGIVIYKEIEFVYLYRRGWVEASRWPHFTILGQSLGSLVLGLEALIKFSPNVFIDTTGYAFVVPLFRWLGSCKTVSYVHYPTVSQDMLDKVKQNEPSYNSSGARKSNFWVNLKLIYYRLYAKIYGFVGRRNDVVMVNSTWTHGHISRIWGPKNLYIVYPPCDTTTFQQLPITRESGKFNVVSVGQFRPEKDHKLQLTIFDQFLKHLDERDRKRAQLVLIGSCRNQEDRDRVIELRAAVKHLKINEHVRFKINVAYDKLIKELGSSTVAIHTMWNEHFGIGLVECMAAGCVMIGHKSGGPKMDIVVEWKGQDTGYLAASVEHYVSCLLEVFHMSEVERMRVVSSAREAVRSKFSVEVFEASFLRATEHLFS